MTMIAVSCAGQRLQPPSASSSATPCSKPCFVGWLIPRVRPAGRRHKPAPQWPAGRRRRALEVSECRLEWKHVSRRRASLHVRWIASPGVFCFLHPHHRQQQQQQHLWKAILETAMRAKTVYRRLLPAEKLNVHSRRNHCGNRKEHTHRFNGLFQANLRKPVASLVTLTGKM